MKYWINPSLVACTIFFCWLTPQRVHAQSIQVQSGWNLLSLPAAVANGARASLFPNATSRAFMYDNTGYQPKETLKCGNGFWLKFSSSGAVSITGAPIFNDTIMVDSGWNIVGGLAVPIAVKSINTDPPGIMASDVFGFNMGQGYQKTDTLQPGAGYWVKVNRSGKLGLSSYILAPQVKVLSDTIKQNIISISADQDTLFLQGGNSGVIPGQILVSDTGAGLLRKVIRADQIGNETRILTAAASLVDVFPEASIVDSFTITEAMVKEVRDAIPGVRLVKSGKPNVLQFGFTDAVLYDQDKNLTTKGDQVTASGSLSIALRPKLGLQIHNGEVTRFSFSIEPTAVIELNFDVPLEIPIVDDSIKIATIHTSPNFFFVGPVPVVITNEIPIYLGLNGSVKVSLTAGMKNTTSLLLGAVYQNGVWSPLSRFTNQFEYTLPSLSGEAKLQVYVKPQLKMKLYGVAGPTVSMKGYVEGEGGITINSISGEAKLNAEIDAGIQASVGVVMEVFDVKLTSWDSPPLVDVQWKLLDWTEALNRIPNAPSAPSPSDSAADQSTSLTVTWSCSDPYNDPLTYDVYFGKDNPPAAMISSDQSDTSMNMSGLKLNTRYFWQIVAKDNQGNSTSGPIWTFTTSSDGTTGAPCPGTPTVSYLGKTYHTVQIGNQCWLKENLDVGIIIKDSYNQNDNNIIEKYCIDNDTANCRIYGGLYQWNEAMQYGTTEGARGFCPTGWHIPKEAEFQTLASTVNNDGNALQAVGQHSGRGTGTNTSGFSALLAGLRDVYTGFYGAGNDAIFWSSSQYDAALASSIGLGYDVSDIFISDNYKNSGFSVRCLKDDSSRMERSENSLKKMNEQEQSLPIGSVVPDINLPDSSGNSISLNAMNAEKMLIVFYSSSCPHCMTLIPRLAEISKNNALNVLAVSLDNNRNDWLNFIRTYNLNWINVIDTKGWTGKAAAAYHTYGTPTMILIDKNKKILAKPLTIEGLAKLL